MQNPKIEAWGAKGMFSALLIITCWASSLTFLLKTDFSLTLLLGVPIQAMLFTGLFITAHDAMHGTVYPPNRKVNNAIGTLSVWLYALFSFRKLWEKHQEHHAHPGDAQDPDFHDGEHDSFARWYLRFVRHYVTWHQLVGMALVFNILEHVLDVAIVNLLLFWVLPSVLSTLQLFYFGTYLPHRGHPDSPHHARSNAYSTFWSFVTCYHFGYHLEHHEHPWAPWWHLPHIYKTPE